METLAFNFWSQKKKIFEDLYNATPPSPGQSMHFIPAPTPMYEKSVKIVVY